MNALHFVVVFAAVILLFGFMAGSLTYARYKKRSSGCCGGGCHNQSKGSVHSDRACRRGKP